MVHFAVIVQYEQYEQPDKLRGKLDRSRAISIHVRFVSKVSKLSIVLSRRLRYKTNERIDVEAKTNLKKYRCAGLYLLLLEYSNPLK